MDDPAIRFAHLDRPTLLTFVNEVEAVEDNNGFATAVDDAPSAVDDATPHDESAVDDETIDSGAIDWGEVERRADEVAARGIRPLAAALNDEATYNAMAHAGHRAAIEGVAALSSSETSAVRKDLATMGEGLLDTIVEEGEERADQNRHYERRFKKMNEQASANREALAAHAFESAASTRRLEDKHDGDISEVRTMIDSLWETLAMFAGEGAVYFAVGAAMIPMADSLEIAISEFLGFGSLCCGLSFAHCACAAQGSSVYDVVLHFASAMQDYILRHAKSVRLSLEGFMSWVLGTEGEVTAAEPTLHLNLGEDVGQADPDGDGQAGAEQQENVLDESAAGPPAPTTQRSKKRRDRRVKVSRDQQ